MADNSTQGLAIHGKANEGREVKVTRRNQWGVGLALDWQRGRIDDCLLVLVVRSSTVTFATDFYGRHARSTRKPDSGEASFWCGGRRRLGGGRDLRLGGNDPGRYFFFGR